MSSHTVWIPTVTSALQRQMEANSIQIFIVPGISNSGPDHWQTYWEKKHGGIRIEQDEWEKPDYFQWEAALIRQVRQFTTQIPQTAILVGHSLGCLLIAKALEKVRRQISGILLVAPPDPDSPAFPPGLDEFHRLPNHPLSIPGAILYSENDRFANPEFVQKIAFQWGIEAISVGTLGHINSDSKLSDWEQGWEIFSRIFPKKQETAGKS